MTRKKIIIITISMFKNVKNFKIITDFMSIFLKLLKLSNFRGDWRRALEFPVGIIPAGTSNALSRALLDTQVQ